MMIGKKMGYLIGALVASFAFLGWKLISRNGYESAAYTVIKSEAPFEVREYPQLMMATTVMKSDQPSEGDSFSRLFGYITGANDEEAKVAMTTPVFMEREATDSPGQMSFVIPQKVAQAGIPAPARRDVQIRQRAKGSFAVIRFAGRIDSQSIAEAEEKLRAWMDQTQLRGLGQTETAGYDPPWTPGPLRRNEVLIRLDEE